MSTAKGPSLRQINTVAQMRFLKHWERFGDLGKRAGGSLS